MRLCGQQEKKGKDREPPLTSSCSCAALATPSALSRSASSCTFSLSAVPRASAALRASRSSATASASFTLSSAASRLAPSSCSSSTRGEAKPRVQTADTDQRMAVRVQDKSLTPPWHPVL